MTESTEWRVPLPDGETRALFEPAIGADPRATFVFAHGAGGHRADRGMEALAGRFRAIGMDVVRFNFAYSERGSRRPDPIPALMACIAAVTERVKAELAPATLILGGRSMGGRAASMLVSQGFRCNGLLLLAYPLHPAGKPGKLRDAHLPAITTPTLCINGTRDALCDRVLMERVVARLSRTWTMYWLEGADHSFHVLKSSGRTEAEALDEVAAATAKWQSFPISS